jgi:hypothetical protein
VILQGNARRSSSGTSSAQAQIGFYDKDGTLLSAPAGSAVSLTTSYQVFQAIATAPANTMSVAFGVGCSSITSGEAYIDDVTAFFLPYQDQHFEADGPTNFTTETVIGTVTMVSPRETGFFDVIVQAKCDVLLANSDNVFTFRIRRSNLAGAVLNGSTTAIFPGTAAGTSHNVFTQGWDSDPNTTSQDYVFTAERSGTGTPSAFRIALLASQRNVLLL